jgi:hypothetical protein
VVKHRAEIAHVKPVFKEVKLNLFSPMASERNAPPFCELRNRSGIARTENRERQRQSSGLPKSALGWQ